jgi:hypothetical protein
MGKDTNAKAEFIQHVNGRRVLCATISLDYPEYDDEENEKDYKHVLTTGYTSDEYSQFLESLDKKYDSGYGGQRLFGTIWYKDGTWSSRGEYDGSEWWAHHTCPIIPKDIRRIDKEREEKLDDIMNGHNTETELTTYSKFENRIMEWANGNETAGKLTRDLFNILNNDDKLKSS